MYYCCWKIPVTATATTKGDSPHSLFFLLEMIHNPSIQDIYCCPPWQLSKQYTKWCTKDQPHTASSSSKPRFRNIPSAANTYTHADDITRSYDDREQPPPPLKKRKQEGNTSLNKINITHILSSPDRNVHDPAAPRGSPCTCPPQEHTALLHGITHLKHPTFRRPIFLLEKTPLK